MANSWQYGGHMTWFIDRRLNGKNKSTVNRQRFLRRYKSQIKQSISEAINKRSVTDVDSGESVSIPTDDISEPMFHQGRGGLRHRVHPGNDHFVQNDRIERPQGAAAVQEADKARPVRMERVRMSSSFRYLKMNILICCSKI